MGEFFDLEYIDSLENIHFCLGLIIFNSASLPFWIQFTFMLGANSAAKETVKPSIAPFDVDIIVWFINPCLAAIDENNRTDPLFFF